MSNKIKLFIDHMYKASAFISGSPVFTDETIDIVSPIDGNIVGSIPRLEEKHIKEAFESSEDAFKKWRELDYKTRVKFMLQFSSKLREHASVIANITHLEIGKNVESAHDEIIRSAEYIVESAHAYSDLIENSEKYDNANNILIPKNIFALYMRKPLGVVLSISPFNYPINLMITKIVPALLVGNSVIHKSSTNGSLVGWYIAKLLHEVTVDNFLITPGVFNYVTGKGREIGKWLIGSDRVNAISFTGSTDTGLEIAKSFPMIPKQMEMGGHNPAVVMKDADIQLAVKSIISGAFSFSGQRCTSIKRIFIDKKIKKEFINRLKEALKDFRLNEPLIDQSSVEKFGEACEDAVAKGAEYVSAPFSSSGNYVSHVILDGVKRGMILFEEEIFAPIMAITEYEKEEEIYELCNDSKYGLQCSIFSEDTDAASKMSIKLEFGRVNINSAPARSPDILPFSGIKNSGFDVQGIKNSLYFFTRFQGLVLEKNIDG